MSPVFSHSELKRYHVMNLLFWPKNNVTNSWIMIGFSVNVVSFYCYWAVNVDVLLRNVSLRHIRAEPPRPGAALSQISFVVRSCFGENRPTPLPPAV